MSNDFDKKLDWKIRDNLYKEAEKIEVPSLDKQKEAFKKRYLINDNKLLSKVHKYGLVAAVFVIIVFSLTLYQAKAANAFGPKFFDMIKNFLGGTMYNINTVDTVDQNRSNPQVPQMGSVDTITDQNISIDELQKSVYFQIGQPAYLPAGTKLNNVKALKSGDKIRIQIEFDIRDQKLTLYQQNYFDSNNNSYVYDSDDAAIKEITVNGAKGQLIQTKDGSLRIVWTQRGINFDLIGNLDQSEMLKVANSIN